MRAISTSLAAIALIVVLVVVFAYSGIYDVSARSEHGGISSWFLSTTSRSSIARRARHIEVPELDDDALVLAGVNDFNAMCVGCHGAPGREPDAAGQGLNPPAPRLADSAERMTAAELFWVTKNGIRMTGMPAWGATHDDASLWPVVAFMQQLPTMSAEEYELLVESAAGHGHHDSTDGYGGHNQRSEASAVPDPGTHDHADHESEAPPEEKPPHVHDDGHDHTH